MKNPISSLPFFADKDILFVEDIESRFEGNELWLVATKDDIFVVRKAGRGDGDANMEHSISLLAYQAGVAPEVLEYDNHDSMMVTKWIEGEHKDRLGVDDLIQLVETLKKLHSIDISDINIRSIDIKAIVESEDGIDEAFDICDKYPSQTVLCHNDPNPQNIIWSENGVKLIDYEYAGLNDIYFDLAGVSVEFGLSEVGDRVLLEEYWGDDNYLLDKFHACKAIYDALRRQWIEDHTP